MKSYFKKQAAILVAVLGFVVANSPSAQAYSTKGAFGKKPFSISIPSFKSGTIGRYTFGNRRYKVIAVPTSRIGRKGAGYKAMLLICGRVCDPKKRGVALGLRKDGRWQHRPKRNGTIQK